MNVVPDVSTAGLWKNYDEITIIARRRNPRRTGRRSTVFNAYTKRVQVEKQIGMRGYVLKHERTAV